MNPNDPNVALIEIVAERLGDDLRENVVFVGGAVAGLLITDSAMPAIRPTEDVDLVCQAAVLSDYHRVEKALRAQGFVQDLRPQAPICRWQIGHVVVDVMPPLEEVLGFANRWYPLALVTAQPVVLPSGRTIKLIAAPVFVATKLEAFAGRGNSDFLFSHDLGDLLAVVDGRDALLEECRTSALNRLSALAVARVAGLRRLVPRVTQMRLHLSFQRAVDHVLEHLGVQLLHILRALAVPHQLVQHLRRQYHVAAPRGQAASSQRADTQFNLQTPGLPSRVFRGFLSRAGFGCAGLPACLPLDGVQNDTPRHFHFRNLFAPYCGTLLRNRRP